MRRPLIATVLMATLVGCESTPPPHSSDGGHSKDAGVDGGGTDGGVCQVKLLMILDQSGSMCATDPPGNQGSAFCQRFVSPAGVTEPARIRVLKALMDSFQTRPEVSVLLLPFDLNVNETAQWPLPSAPDRFARPDGGLISQLSMVQNLLGKAADFEGALNTAYLAMKSDVLAQKARDPAVLGRTRYVVVFISDGVPFPRCSVNDALPTYANSTAPAGIWPDSPGTGSYCNTAMTSDVIKGFVPGTDRNQNAALFSKVDAMRALAVDAGVREVQFNSHLLFNIANITTCGMTCLDLYGTYAEVAPDQYPYSAFAVAQWTMQQLAMRGGGRYSETLNNGELTRLSFSDLDLGPNACQ